MKWKNVIGLVMFVMALLGMIPSTQAGPVPNGGGGGGGGGTGACAAHAGAKGKADARKANRLRLQF